MRTRRVVREYTDHRIDDTTLDQMLAAMLAAPSASNKQAWAFVAVREPRMLRLIRAFAPGIIGHPQLIVAACFDRTRAARPEGRVPGAWEVGLLCVGMAVENLLLAAHALGLGGCPVSSFRKDPIRTLLDLPAHLEPVLLVPIGHPAQPVEPNHRRDRNEVISYDSWNQRATADR
ncbi:nitroreductase family protein [Nocardia sp. NPDC051570]|uniref:nitroreductase family protein n=1 Tax=Nocardia sp. NPDC051570 TaxID=3364324 RepID=UPI00379DF846